MRVGVILFWISCLIFWICIPHASGGDPKYRMFMDSIGEVFPMRVGVILQNQVS